MAPKQVEMDEVVERIYRYLENRDAEDGQRSLLVVVGDHGMTEVRTLGSSEFRVSRLTQSFRAAITAAQPKPRPLRYAPPQLPLPRRALTNATFLGPSPCRTDSAPERPKETGRARLALQALRGCPADRPRADLERAL